MKATRKRNILVTARFCALALMFIALGVLDAHAQAKKPNILVIFGDDVGYWNVTFS